MYAEACYQDFPEEAIPEACRVTIQPNIPFSNKRVVCPFDPSMCIDMENPGIEFDSGLVDLNAGFGMNLAPKDRVKYRRKTSCAILDIQNRSETVISAEATQNTQYGYSASDEVFRIVHVGDTRAGDSQSTNITFVQSLLKSIVSTGGYETRYVDASYHT